MPRKSKTITTTIQTREELEERMGDYAKLAIERARLAAQMNRKLADIRANYEALFADLDVDMELKFADLEAWAALHKAEFANRKSLDLLHGALGYRTGQPALRCLRGVRWEDVLSQLRTLAMGQYIRVREEADKEALLSARHTLGDDRLEALGLRVEQAERFFVDPRIEQPETPAA